MRTFIAALLLSVCVACTCYGQSANPGPPEVDPKLILSDNNTFNTYMYYNLKLLSANYTAYDTHLKPISKLEFLKQLTTGNYLFLKLSSTNGKLYFKLYKISPSVNKDCYELISGYAPSFYADYQRVGKKFPHFSFTDINGTTYTSENTKGKIVVLKCWFIGCQACQQEMPALNTMMQAYKNRKDIVFISLAPDAKDKLQTFFSRRQFDYAKVGSQDAFITKTLNVQEYPTHFIINKQGIIVNVVNTADELQYALQHDL